MRRKQTYRVRLMTLPPYVPLEQRYQHSPPSSELGTNTPVKTRFFSWPAHCFVRKS